MTRLNYYQKLYKFIFMILVMSFNTFVKAENNQQKDSLAIVQLCDNAKKNIFKNYSSAITDLNTAWNLAEKSNFKILQFAVLRRFGYTYEQNNRLKEALDYYNRALTLEKEVKDSAKMDIYIDLAIIHKKIGNYTLSKEFYEKTLNFAYSKNDLEMVEYALNGLGTLHKGTAEYDKAVDYFLQSVAAAEKRNNKKGVVISKRNIAEVYLKAENFDQALKVIQECYDMCLSLDDKEWLGNVLNVYGTIYTAKKDYNKALSKHNEALKIFEDIGNTREILFSLSFIADVYFQQKDYATAEPYFKKCFGYKEYFQYADEPVFYQKIGKLYYETGRYELATVYLKQSLDLAVKRNFKDLIQKNSKILSDIYQIKGDYTQAYAYLKTANRYVDSIFSDEKFMRMAEIQFKFDIEKKENEIRNQKEKEIQNLESKQIAWMGGGVIAFLFVLTALLVYFLRQKNKNNKKLMEMNHEVALQNEKLEKSNEILRQFAYASAHDLKEPLRSISSFIHIIQRRYMKLLPPESEEYMNFVTSGVKRMETLLSALLEYSTVASDQQVIVNPTAIIQVLDDVKDNLHVTIVNKEAVIETKGVLPSVLVSKLHLTQLFQNLISNSMKFTTKKPHIKIEGVLLENELMIKLQDNGIGIKKEYSDKIFHLFHRLSRAPQYEGTGIGLTICKNIVDKYDGKIWFESVEGEGTTFFIVFPIALIKNENQQDAVKNKTSPVETKVKS